MSKFAWLKDYREIEMDIIYLENNLERTKKHLDRFVSGDLQNVKLTAESDGAKLEEHIERIEWELAYRMNELQDIKRMVQRFDQVDHQILYGRYIEGKTFDEIADDIGYSKGTVYNKHAALMKTIGYLDELSV